MDSLLTPIELGAAALVSFRLALLMARMCLDGLFRAFPARPASGKEK